MWSTRRSIELTKEKPIVYDLVMVRLTIVRFPNADASEGVRNRFNFIGRDIAWLVLLLHVAGTGKPGWLTWLAVVGFQRRSESRSFPILPAHHHTCAQHD